MSFHSQYFELNNNDTNYNLLDNKTIKNNIQKKHNKTNKPVNTFPLAWTCYKKNGKFFCPMRGDK